MDNEMDATGERLQAGLDRIRGKECLPADLLDLLGTVAREQAVAQATAKVDLPSGLAPADEVLQGRALVDRESFPFDRKQAIKLFGLFLSVAKKADDPLAAAAGIIATACDTDELDISTLFGRVLDDDADYFSTWAKRTPDAPQTLYFLAYAAMSPSLAASAALLAKSLPEAKSWHAGTCPVCGSLPLISQLRDKEGVRLATCSFCRHEYRVRRLACIVCGESDLAKLTYFTVDEEPGFRVEVCASCKTYVKTIDFREMDRKAMPEFDDLDSLALDFVAREQGYMRPTLSAWGF